MSLVKTSILSFIATSIKIVAGLVINKAIAVFVGSTGLALVGQFQDFIRLAMTAAQGGINAGVTKYTAEYSKDGTKIPLLFATSARISLVSSFIVGGILIISPKVLSEFFLKSGEYQNIFRLFGFTIILFVFNNFLLSILNGLKEIKLWAVINITQSIYALIFTTLLIFFFEVKGVLIALVTNQSIVFVVVLWMLKKHPTVRLEYFLGGYSRSEAKNLFKYAAMAVTTAIAVPVSHIVIRNHIVMNLGWEQAGYWQGIWYISSMYLTVVTTTLGIYYLPTLSQIQGQKEILKEISSGLRLIAPIIVLISFVVFTLKDTIISVLFTQEFLPMRELFLWQMVGNVLKIIAWLFSYVMLAKAMTKLYIGTEILFSISFVVLSLFFTDAFGLVGMSYSFALNYAIYLVVIVVLVKGNLTA